MSVLVFPLHSSVCAAVITQTSPAHARGDEYLRPPQARCASGCCTPRAAARWSPRRWDSRRRCAASITGRGRASVSSSAPSGTTPAGARADRRDYYLIVLCGRARFVGCEACALGVFGVFFPSLLFVANAAATPPVKPCSRRRLRQTRGKRRSLVLSLRASRAFSFPTPPLSPSPDQPQHTLSLSLPTPTHPAASPSRRK